MYRKTCKSVMRRQWHPRPMVAESDQRPDAWRPPKLRRRITIEDFDGADTRVHLVELYRTPRIDSYRAVIDGREYRARIGWSRVLDRLRVAMPRMASPRHFDG